MIRANIVGNRLSKSSLLFMMILGLISCGGKGPVSGETKPPIGLWVWKAEPEPHELSVAIAQRDNQWTASVNRQLFSVAVNGKHVFLESTNGQSFTGRISEDGNMVSGYWQQPTTELAYSAMVTKVELNKVDSHSWSGEQSWKGKLKLQPRPFHVFLDIFDDSNGGVKAVIRNPERNQIMRATSFDVHHATGDRWLLVAIRGSRKIEAPVQLIGNQILQLTHSWFEGPLYMTPATRKQSEQYHSRQSPNGVAKYTPPQQKNDGWQTAAAGEAGFDEAILRDLVERLSTADPRDVRPNLIHSMLIAHKGHLVFEEYFYGHNAKKVHDTRSLAKVFGSVMVGAMQLKEYHIGPNDKPFEALLSLTTESIDGTREQDFTLGHIMSYTSGLDCNDISTDSPGEEDTMWQQDEEENFWLYTAQLPQIYPPGERYAYCSGSANLVGAGISEEMKMPIFKAFDQLIAQPLQFGVYHWNLMPNGEGYLGGGVYMQPRDILKIGALYAGGGVWNGKRILSQAWIEESTTTKIAITPETTKMTQEEFSRNYFGGGQAYIWRTDKVTTKMGEYDSFEATGNGGQILLVIPELELTVVFTGGNYGMGYIWGRWRNDLVGGYVIPALFNKKQSVSKIIE